MTATYNVKSKCCDANVYPDGIKGVLFCSKCEAELGNIIEGNDKIEVEQNG